MNRTGNKRYLCGIIRSGNYTLENFNSFFSDSNSLKKKTLLWCWLVQISFPFSSIRFGSCGLGSD